MWGKIMGFNIFKPKKEEKKKTLDDFVKKDVDEDSESEKETSDETQDKVADNGFGDEKLTALDCFGLTEKKADGWLSRCAKIWHTIMSFFWFLFGALTFAPVMFISRQIDVIFKDKKKSLIIAAIFHIIILILLVLFLGARMRACSGN